MFSYPSLWKSGGNPFLGSDLFAVCLPQWPFLFFWANWRFWSQVSYSPPPLGRVFPELLGLIPFTLFKQLFSLSRVNTIKRTWKTDLLFLNIFKLPSLPFLLYFNRSLLWKSFVRGFYLDVWWMAPGSSTQHTFNGLKHHVMLPISRIWKLQTALQSQLWKFSHLGGGKMIIDRKSSITLRSGSRKLGWGCWEELLGGSWLHLHMDTQAN